MTEKRFIEFMTQNSDDGKLNHGFKDMVREEWYHTKDEKTAKKCVDLLNEQEERIKELETVIQQILYETKANYTKEEYSATVSISPQMHDKLTELITEVK